MPRKKRSGATEVPSERQIFRYWIEIRELNAGSTRELPLGEITIIHLPMKKNQPRMPDQHVLKLEDGSSKLEFESFDRLVADLRRMYPDGAYERRLYKVRDREAEQRHADAMNGLIEILAKAVVDDYFHEEAAVRGGPADAQGTNRRP